MDKKQVIMDVLDEEGIKNKRVQSYIADRILEALERLDVDVKRENPEPRYVASVNRALDKIQSLREQPKVEKIEEVNVRNVRECVNGIDALSTKLNEAIAAINQLRGV
uniref:Uncharacterized protein n=1 Tax=viral metagenome TaxID=1070528 RepID=A0A6M3IRR5_9ZZZZ